MAGIRNRQIEAFMNEGLTLNEDRAFGQWLKQRRRELDFTQEKFGDLVGCSWETIRKIEEGKRNPSRQVAALMADMLGIAPEDRESFIHFARTGSIGVAPANLPHTNGKAHPPAPAGERPQTPTNPTNLSTWATSFIGRAAEVAAVRALLLEEGVRLLTLTGPAGIGKSRLSIEAASGLLPDFSDGVYFVPLSPVTEPALVIAAITQALGLKESPGQARMDLLKDYLREKRFLLVLDNFEQVIEAGPLVIELLTACPGLEVIVSSRGPLHVHGEHEFAVPPLSVPDSQEAEKLSADELLQTEAVALFVERSRAVDARFTLTADNAPVIAEICRQLDALPLAIELAAARMKVLSPQAILARLSNRLKLLTTGPLDAPDRQRTLRNAIEWSYDLLDEDEKALYRRLSVFVGPRSIDAVEAVCSTGAGEEGRLPADPGAFPPVQMSAVDGIESLLDQSLLRYEDGEDGERRFYMLWTIREYGLEQLAKSGEEEAVRRRHAAFFASLAEEAEPYLTSGGRDPWVKKLDEELENLRAAMTWCQANAEDTGQVELGLRMAGALGWYWYFKGYFSEGQRWLERAVSQDRESGRTMFRARALYAAGRLADISGDNEAARSFLDESAALWRSIGNKRGLAYALILLAVHIVREDVQEARSLCEESVRLFKETDDKWGLAYALDYFADTVWWSGDVEQVTALLNQSLSLYQELGDKWGVAAELRQLGNMALYREDYLTAISYLQDALSVEKEVGDRWNSAHLTYGLGYAALLKEDYPWASSLFEESRRKFGELGIKKGVAGSLRYLGYITREQCDYGRAKGIEKEYLTLVPKLNTEGDKTVCLSALASLAFLLDQPERAAILLGVVDVRCDTSSQYFTTIDRKYHELSLSAVREHLDRATFEEAWVRGQGMTLEQAIEYALEPI